MLVSRLIEAMGHEDIKALARDLQGLVGHHISWLNRIHKIFICQQELDYPLARDYRKCAFGQWYYGVTQPELKQSAEFTHIGQLHRQVHEMATEMLLQYERNGVVAETLYGEFSVVEQTFVAEVEALAYAIDDTTRQFDSLTRLPARSLMGIVIEKEQSKVTRGMGRCALVMSDIDHFKAINDRYGHPAGDRVLVEIARYFEDSLRRYDVVSRYGGEEFLFSMPESTLEEAWEVSERLRLGLEQLSITVAPGTEVQLTASFGVSEMDPREPLSSAIGHADKALYQAKSEGRNRVCTWSPMQSSARGVSA
ncbi:diguanylate cyclase [Aestuariirhabdus sp. LZHN29]|uniref:diguanylate cyclase n=1 Tax=Aestuariirhabdus sp. LZHN29 TaxID=3417462 RepID=UPI003CEC77BD